jgi:hypothetical protein
MKLYWLRVSSVLRSGDVSRRCRGFSNNRVGLFLETLPQRKIGGDNHSGRFCRVARSTRPSYTFFLLEPSFVYSVLLHNRPQFTLYWCPLYIFILKHRFTRRSVVFHFHVYSCLHRAPHSSRSPWLARIPSLHEYLRTERATRSRR